MELLVMGAVAALGYELGRRADKQGPESNTNLPEPKSTSDMLAYEAEVRKKHFEAAGKPRVTGVFDPLSGPNMVDLARGTKPMLATEGFSSPQSMTGIWKRKREAGPRFSPLESAVPRLGSTGSAGNPNSRLRNPVVGGRTHNILPTTQVRVGRGVGYGPDVPAADGFHPYLRIFPHNEGAFRRNPLPGGIVPGKSNIDLRKLPWWYIGAYKPPTFYDLKRRPLAQQMAYVRAAKERPLEPREVRKGHDSYSDASEEYFGNPYAVNAVPTSGNASADYVVTRTQNERTMRSGTDAIAPGTAIPGPTPGMESVREDEGRVEKLHNYEADRLGSAPVATLVKQSGTEQMKDGSKLETTLREITGARPYGHFLGIAGPTYGWLVQSGETNQDSSKQLDRHAKRGDHLVEDYVPMGKLKRPDELTHGIFQSKNREKGGRLMGTAQILGASTNVVNVNNPGYHGGAILNVEHIGRRDTGRAPSDRTSQDNPRTMDLDIASRQLSDNPFNHNFTPRRPRSSQ